jgi:hypothetical protein
VGEAEAEPKLTIILHQTKEPPENSNPIDLLLNKSKERFIGKSDPKLGLKSVNADDEPSITTIVEVEEPAVDRSLGRNPDGRASPKWPTPRLSDLKD